MELDKLSATDRVFLDIEGGALMMHVAAVMVFDGGGLVGPDGALDFDRIERMLEAATAEVPRFRQVVREVPGLGAVWVDDARFAIGAHVMRTAIPRPGGEAQLMGLAGRVLSRPLDRRHPLWEVWLVEGLADGRFAMIVKAHHAMVDGVAGMGALASLLRVEPGDDPPPAPPWRPRPAPTRVEIAAALAGDSARAVAGALKELRTVFEDHGAHARDIAGGIVDTLREGLTPAAATSINPDETGPRRSFTAVTLDLGRVRELRRALGGTLNDLVLTTVTGGIRRYLSRRGDAVDALDDFRALIPVNLRPREDGHGGVGNHISMVLAQLPVAVGDARARLAAVRATCEHLKHESHEIEGAAFVERVGDLGGPNVVSAVFRVAAMLRAFNVTVTNVPGPQVPLYLGRARMTAIHAVVPLFTHQGVGVAALSYDGALSVGLYADPDAVPELDALAGDVSAAFDELCALAGAPADP